MTAPPEFEKIERCTDGMPVFSTQPLGKLHRVSMPIKITGIQPVEKFAGECLFYPCTCYFLLLINLIIEKSGIGFHQFHREQINFCLLEFRNELHSEKRSPHVDFPYI